MTDTASSAEERFATDWVLVSDGPVPDRIELVDDDPADTAGDPNFDPWSLPALSPEELDAL